MGVVAEGINAGSVYVEIRPDLSRFGARARKQVEAQADKAGDAYGKTFVHAAERHLRRGMAVLLRQTTTQTRKTARDAGRAFGDTFTREAKGAGKEVGAELGDGITEETTRRTRDMPIGPSPTQSRRQGTEAGGGFADAFKRQVTAALKSLPAPQIGPARDGEEQRLRDLTASLRELSGKRVGVDIDTSAALAQVQRINRELQDLARQSPNIRVQVDTAAASAQLIAMEDRVRRLSGHTININTRADTSQTTAGIAAIGATASGSMAGISALITAGVALGPAIVPAAAAVVGALAAIGPMAVVGASAIGVMGLAFSGVSEAVSALGDAEDNAGAQAAKAAVQHAAMASAADRVRQARAGLASAERQVAQAARQSSRDVADAQKALTRAEADALSVRKSLTQAYRDAREAQADLASQVQSNALAQRQAVLDVAETQREMAAAQAAYDTAAASPATSAARLTLLRDELEQAKIRYETQALQQTDLGRKGKQLAAEQATANRKGIEGSAQVVAARERIADADAQVESAQRRVSDAQAAREQARVAGAERIAAAQQQIVAAQRAAAVAAASTATALDPVAKAMGALGPAGQSFARFLNDLRPAFMQLKGVAEEGLFGGIRQGLEALKPVFPQILLFVGRVSKALGGFFAAFGKAMGSPEWVSFFDTMGKLAGPLMKSAATILTGLGKAFAVLMVAFAPLAEDFAAALGEMATAFAGWAAGFVKSQAFADFVAYLSKNGPVLADLFFALIKLAVQLLIAFAPFGEDLIAGLLKMFDFLANLDLNVLLGVVYAIAAAIGVLIALAGGPVYAVIAAIAVAVVAFLALWSRIRPAMEPIFAWLRSAFSYLWNNVIKPAWEGISSAISWAWNNIIKPALAAISWFVSNVLAPAFTWLWQKVIQPVWTGIKIAISVAWALIKVVFGLIQIGVKVVGAVFKWLYEKAIRPAFNALYDNVIKPVWDKIKPVFAAIGGYIKDKVVPAFKGGVTAIGKAWDGIREAAKKPVKFVVDTILNNGLLAAYNKLAKTFNVKPDDVKITLPKGFAIGGAVRGPGTGTSDSIVARLSNDEHVWTAREVAAAGGHRAVEQMRQSVLGGRAGFARGGAVGTGDGLGDLFAKAKKKATDVITGVGSLLRDPAGLIKKLAARLTALIPGRDTSAGRIVSAIPVKIADLLAGKLGGLFAGGAEGGNLPPPSGSALGWQNQMRVLRSVFPGLALNSGFRPGSITATGNLSYHARGRAVDVPPKMAVFNWIAKNFPNSRELIFSPANHRQIWNGRPHFYSEPTRSDHYDHVHWAYDSGGYIPPGISTVYNGTGKPEPVLTDGQWKLMMASAKAGTGGEHHTHYEVRDDQATLARVQAKRDLDHVLARAGRRP